jgi:hypothetical protein
MIAQSPNLTNSPVTAISIIAPIGLAAAAMLLSFVVKAILNGSSFKRSNSARGYELFRLCFLGPDLSLLALGLFVSSQALRSLLNGHNISTNFGDNFGTYFWTCVLLAIVALLFSTLCWLPHDDDERAFRVKTSREERQQRDGTSREVDIYEVQTLETLTRFSAFLILVVGNLIGIMAILGYVLFIFRGFVPRG